MSKQGDPERDLLNIKTLFKKSIGPIVPIISKQERFNQCLTDMKGILNKAGVPFFLICGTLLGAYREGKFIEYDGDIDIGILRSNYTSEIKAEILKSRLFRVGVQGDPNRSLEYKNYHVNGVCIDIFFFYNMDLPYKYYHALFAGLCDKKPGGFCKRVHHMRGFIPTSFMGNNYLIPANTEEVLVESYGADWRIPKRMTYTEGLNGGFTNIE
uniref:LicD/FKTN/FKRP nucleotidyltransferase domain-containing protein n=1 Tax=viral metagenome TaxID=1070528 RepID=A0A6C0DTH0_9ZZZZ